MFIGKSLTNLRIMHGYSRKQLSDKLNITEQAVWQYENGYTSPKMEVVNRLKSIFKVKSKYFYKEDVLSRFSEPENIPTMNIAYRSRIMNVMSKTQAEAKHVEFLDSFINYLTANVVHPTQRIVRLRDTVIEYLNTTQEDRNTQINQAALMAREKLGLRSDNNEDFLFRVEKSGVFVFEKAIGERIDAYSLWTKQERPFIILGNLKRSAVRWNFDIAHELGHLLLHYKVEFSGLDKKEHKALEDEANQFASAFLLPEDSFKEDMRTIVRPTNPDAYIDLKRKWKTSLQVLGYRAAGLDLMGAKDHRNFYAALHRKGYPKIEPFDDTFSIQKPQKVKSIIDLVAKKDLVDLRQMLDKDWMAELSFFHHLTGIDPAFFSKYMVEETHDFELLDVHELSSIRVT